MSAVLDLPLPATTEDTAARTVEAIQPPADPIATSTPKSKKGKKKPQTTAEYRNSWQTFSPRHSIAVFTLPLEMGSGIAQKRFGEWFGRLQTATHMLCNHLPDLIGAVAAQEVLDVLTTQTVAAEEALKAELAELRSQATEAGLRQEREWSRPITLSVPCSNRYHRDFLNIVRIFDDIIWHLDALTTFGIISNRERISKRQKTAKIVGSVSTGTSAMWGRAKASAMRDMTDKASVKALTDAEKWSHEQSRQIVSDINAQVAEHGIESDPSDEADSAAEAD